MAFWVDYHFILNQAYRKYKKINKLADNGNSARRFKKFLGIPEEGGVLDFMANEEAVQRAQWLLSENGEVLYKIWKARSQNE